MTGLGRWVEQEGERNKGGVAGDDEDFKIKVFG